MSHGSRNAQLNLREGDAHYQAVRYPNVQKLQKKALPAGMAIAIFRRLIGPAEVRWPAYAQARYWRDSASFTVGIPTTPAHSSAVRSFGSTFRAGRPSSSICGSTAFTCPAFISVISSTVLRPKSGLGPVDIWVDGAVFCDRLTRFGGEGFSKQRRSDSRLKNWG